MTYYSRIRRSYEQRESKNVRRLYSLISGPRGIRTLGLLNAIETRSQLRYGPSFPDSLLNFSERSLLSEFSSLSGPGGIRTLGLFSAIEARSQLRYRPLLHRNQDFTRTMPACQDFAAFPKPLFRQEYIGYTQVFNSLRFSPALFPLSAYNLLWR